MPDDSWVFQPGVRFHKTVRVVKSHKQAARADRSVWTWAERGRVCWLFDADHSLSKQSLHEHFQFQSNYSDRTVFRTETSLVWLSTSFILQAINSEFLILSLQLFSCQENKTFSVKNNYPNRDEERQVLHKFGDLSQNKTNKLLDFILDLELILLLL